MEPTVKDIIAIMNGLAAPDLSEDWDNSGLQVGQMDWPVRRVQLALDPSPAVVAAACESDVDLLITHHPLLLKPLKALDFQTPLGRIIASAARSRLAIFSAHTNLDSSEDGVNDQLARRMGLTQLTPLIPAFGAPAVKLVVFAPRDFETRILNAIFESPAGRIGEYTCCSFLSPGEGTFRPGKNSKPFVGELDQITRAPEIRIETIVPRDKITAVLKNVRNAHPYETMAYDLYPLADPREAGPKNGLGRLGMLADTVPLEQFAINIKTEFELPAVRVVGRPDLPVGKAAVCSGSGASLLKHFFNSGADVFISGDIRYHDARTIEEADRGLVDLGHFASEHIVLAPLARRLDAIFTKNKFNITLDVCELETDPFRTL